MAEEKRSTPGQRARRSRPPPTIDLTATEVEARPSPASETAGGTDEKSSPASAAGERVPPGRGTIVRLDYMSHLAAGCVGGVLVALLLIGLWLAGYLPTRDGEAGALRAQVASLQKELQAVARRDTAGPVRVAIDDLKARVDQVEQAASKQRAAAPSDNAMSERIAAIENSLKTLSSALDRRSDAAALAAAQRADSAEQEKQAAELDSLRRRLDAVEQSTKATQDKVAQGNGADSSARRAVAAIALRDAVAQGVPYTSELTALKEIGADAQATAALEPFAATGVPSDVALSREFGDLLPKLIETAGPNPSKASGFLERLEANAAKLVRIRPVYEPPGDDPSAVLARIEVKLARNDAAGAAAELPRLPPNVRALAEPWGNRVAARNAAVAAGRALAAESTGALGGR